MPVTGVRGDAPPEDGFLPLIEIGVDVQVFGSRWVYCDYISTYVARMIGGNRSDSLVFSNLFSSALNELLETAFRHHKAAGTLRCRAMRKGPVDRIEIDVPCGADERQFYVDTVREARAPDLPETYLALLLSDGGPDDRTGIFELAVDYKAEIAVAHRDDGGIRLTVDLVLED